GASVTVPDGRLRSSSGSTRGRGAAGWAGRRAGRGLNEPSRARRRMGALLRGRGGGSAAGAVRTVNGGTGVAAEGVLVNGRANPPQSCGNPLCGRAWPGLKWRPVPSHSHPTEAADVVGRFGHELDQPAQGRRPGGRPPAVGRLLPAAGRP